MLIFLSVKVYTVVQLQVSSHKLLILNTRSRRYDEYDENTFV